VIDDLTIENKKLKEKLRKYEKAQHTHLEKDKLFEVKIHSLPARKRRELEEVLRAFASSISSSKDEENPRIPAKGILPYPSLNPAIGAISKHPSSSSTSNSRPVDSAYASMSSSVPTSTSALNHVVLKGRLGSQPRVGEKQKVQSFLHNIPEGLLPKHSLVMTENQKRKIVVQRLEQLFTGTAGATIGDYSQPLQQQEVSRSAAQAEQPTDDDSMVLEGMREAHILPYTMDVDSGMPAKLSEDSSRDTQVSRSGSSDEYSPSRSPQQRPTRPLDLDPDRAQIPSENVEYIRHLGLSTPYLVSEGSADAADAEGWIYLNLLINMAQLHIINVTPDFVRAAVSDVSEKFQLSRDGKKIRWRGGTKGTQLSSDSGSSSIRNRSHDDSDSLGEIPGKKRRVDVAKFTSVPVDVDMPDRRSRPQNSFHYKPIFHHQSSSSRGMSSSDESESHFGRDARNGSRTGRILPHGRLWSERSRSGSKGRKRNGVGPIVFYSGAKFCTDLSGDQGSIIAPLHITGVEMDGYSNHTQTALGCEPQKKAPPLFRTTSGSLLRFRPFKDYSKGPEFLETEESRPKTPELFKDDSDDGSDFFADCSPTSSGPPTPLQDFEASGLGGTRPADHFAVRVQTRLTIGTVSHPGKRSKRSAPRQKFRKFGHSISKSSLDAFHKSELDVPEEVITARLASLMNLSPGPPQTATREEIPVKAEVLSAQFVRLEPSELPPPASYFTNASSSEDYSDSTSSTGISRLRRDRTFLAKSFASYSDMDDVLDEKGAEPSDEMDEDDSSIDMLAQARELDPSGAAAKEQEFEMDLDVRVGSANLTGRSSAATLNDESACSSESSDSSDSTDF
jgi:hypothetical protein